MTDERLCALVDRIYAAALQPDRWQDFIDALSEELGGTAISLALQMSGHDIPKRAYLVGLDRELGYRLDSHYRKGLPWLPGGPRAFRTAFNPMDELLSIEELEHSAFAADWLVPQGLRVSGGLGHCFASESGAPLAAIVIFERERGRRLGPSDRELCDLLAPHLESAYRIYRRICDQRHERWAMGEAMNRLPVGVVLLDRELRPVITNGTANRILALDDGLSLGPDGLNASNARDDAVMQQIFEDIAEDRRTAANGETILTVSRPSGKRAFPVLVGALHAAGDGDGDGVEDATLSVVFGVPETGQTIPPAALRAAGDLTPAESELVGLLAEGRSLKDAAELRGVSLNTVRTQIKHVFAKTDTNRQGELIRLVLTGAASFQGRGD